MRPIHPGEILRAEYLEPLGICAHALAKALKAPPSRVGDTVLERRGVTPDSALRLARYFGGDAQSWLNLQLAYDLKMAEMALAKVLEQEITPYTAGGDARFALASSAMVTTKPMAGTAGRSHGPAGPQFTGWRGRLGWPSTDTGTSPATVTGRQRPVASSRRCCCP